MSRPPSDVRKVLKEKATTNPDAKPIDYQAVLDAHKGNNTHAARSLKLSLSTFRYRLDRVKRITFSEDEKKFKFWSTEECINELRRIVEEHPDKVITRNFFRVHSEISESTWTRHFGTFEEFKRQASVMPTRHQHKLEKEIAKHAAADHYRELRRGLEDWESKYIIKDTSRYVKMALAFDLHDKDVDPFWLRVWLETLKRFLPSIVCFGGDLFDLPEFSKWTQDPRTWDVTGRIKFAHNKILGPTRLAVGDDCQVDLIEGNHEFRLLRHLADATPALRAVLSDLHGLTIPGLLGLEKFQVNYIARADLASAAYRQIDLRKELRRNFKIYHDQFLIHHYPDGAKMGFPGANGHHHKHVVTPYYGPRYGAYEWHQSGGGHRRDADYTEGELWSNGFPLVIMDTVRRQTIVDYVTIGETIAVSGGKVYYRKPEERIV